MDDSYAPMIIGAAGLLGRPQIVRIPENEEVDEQGNPIGVVKVGQAMPGNCRRVMSSPLPVDRGGGCLPDCPGWQRNGGCLLDVVRAAEAQNVAWAFEVNTQDGFWDYVGDPIDGYEQTRVRPGVVEGSWEPGMEPFDPYAWAAGPPPPPPSFDCPHCDAHVEQDPENFHWWCPDCGSNANDPA